MNHYEQLKNVLNDIFELNKADLDFGIYRIINQKRKQVNAFIEQQLPREIKEALSGTQSAGQVELEQELKQLRKSLEALDMVAEENPKFIEKQAQFNAAADTDALEQDVFSHLANFFRRYYKDGDFISMRRYKKDVYAIPYEGEEVKLHWANHDQYYIKSSENFKNYSFKLPDGPKITFQLKEANTEQNNNKTQGDAERRFALFTEQPVEINNGELFINFVYEPFPKATKQDDLKLVAYKTILEQLPENFATLKSEYRNDKGEGKTRKEKINGKDVEISVDLLFHHLSSYISKNSFDYFIHKDLGGFLHRELDFYIKNEVLYIDDINDREPAFFVAQLGKVKALKAVASKIIEFLAQIENFQKKLWLKKKFVLRTDYCITLDRIPSAYYPEIFDNKTQLEAWKTLYGVEIPNAEQLVFEPFLVLDTQFFSEDFKDRLLYEFKDLDAETDGLLINSENFQALGLLQEKYREEVDLIYIDPPYNTGGDGFTYKDGFRSSSWLSLFNSRFTLSISLFSARGLFFSSIDDNELTNLRLSVESQVGRESFQTQLIIQSNKRGQTYQAISKTHEYLLCYFIGSDCEINEIDKDIDKNAPKDELGGYELWELRNRNPKFGRHNRPNLYYPIYVNTKSLNSEGFALVSLENDGDNFVEVFPKNSSKEDSCWRWGREKFLNAIENRDYLYVIAKQKREGGWNIYEKARKSTTKPKSIWSENDVINEQGTVCLGDLGFKEFGFPKPVGLLNKTIQIGSQNTSLILDYFAGSGTTGHAVIKLNREDGGRRKYILVEMGQYFNTVTKPRIQKVIYTDN